MAQMLETRVFTFPTARPRRRIVNNAGEAALSMISKFSAALLCAASVVAISSAAAAQTADSGVETVTVTGSRIISDITQSPTPLTVVTADELLASTPTNIPDALGKLPVFFGNRSQRNVQNGSSNGSGNVLNLRNFGSSRTLVLLDGHRVAPSNSDGSVDVDILPQMLMSRVDVVTGGASAIYGSDAVSGVVNFVLDKKFSGVKYNISSGISKYGDGAQYQAGVAFGSDILGGRGHFEGALRYYHQDGIKNTSRPYGYGQNTWALAGDGSAAHPFTNVPYARETIRGMNGIITCGAACPANGMTFAEGGVIVPTNPGTATGTAGLNSGGDGGYNQVTSFQASLRTAEAFGRFSYDIDNKTNFYIQGMYSESGNQSFWSPVTLFTTTGRPNQLYSNNAFLPAAAQTALATGNTQVWTSNVAGNPAYFDGNPSYFNDPGYQFNKIGGANARDVGATYRSNSIQGYLGLSAGIDGTVFNKFAWDVYYSHGQARQKEVNPNNTNDAKLMAAMDAVKGPNGTVVCHVSLTASANLYPGCVPLNLVTDQGPSLDGFRYISQETHYIQTNILDDVGANISGPVFALPAGDVNVALSGEMRWAQYDVQSNAVPTATVDCTGLRLCTPGATPLWTQNTAASVSASNNVYEFAAEVGVPILKDIPLIQQLNADFAGRYTNYSTSGEAETWKIGLDYHVNDSVRFRSTMSVDIRAPNLNDLYQPLLISSSGFNDLYTHTNSSVPLHTQGNSALTPEVAHTYTAGVVLTPDFVPGLTMSVDYFKILLSNAIQSTSYSSTAIQNICINSAGTSPYCALAVRPLPFSNNTPANYPSYIISQSLNSANVRTEGLDFEVDYGFDLKDLLDWADGTVNIRQMLTIQPYINTVGFPGAPTAWTPMPDGRATTSLSYSLGDWGINLQNNWLCGFDKRTANGQIYAQQRLNSFDTLDVTLDRKFDFAGGTTDLYFSVQNIGNTQPPLYPTGSTNPGLYYPASSFESGMGRYFTIGLKGSL
ncbi:MAG: tonB dependent receptor family protein [Alphaproteobacteria bacterium]|nr:tonB dependent receptor family protein [Alphaproteobacteria bacterium]